MHFCSVVSVIVLPVRMCRAVFTAFSVAQSGAIVVTLYMFMLITDSSSFTA